MRTTTSGRVVGEVREARWNGAESPHRLTVVLPTRNEAANIVRMVEALLTVPFVSVRVDVLVVDYESTDGTVGLVEALAKIYPGQVSLEAVNTPGLGPAYVAGFRRALAEGADLIAQMDCDFSHEPLDLARMLAVLEQDQADVVLGSRWVAGGSTATTSLSWYRRLLSTFANGKYVKGVLRLPLADATGGFRLWRRETLLGLGLFRVRSHGYVFQVEMASLAHHLGYRLLEVPIHFRKRRSGRSKMSLRIQIEAAWRVLWLLVQHARLDRASRQPVPEVDRSALRTQAATDVALAGFEVLAR